MFTHADSSAIHEAGHAVFAVALGRSLKYITLISDLCGDGAVCRDELFGTAIKALEEIAISLAGEIAADHYGYATDSRWDEHKVSEILRDELLDYEQNDLVARIRAAVAEEINNFEFAITDLVEAIRVPRKLSGSTATEIIQDRLPSQTRLRSKLLDIANTNGTR